MNYKIEFKSEKSIEKLKIETIKYFQEQGFKLVSENNFLIFERGNTLNNMITFNPLKWKSITTVSFEGQRVIANFEINTVYQVVTLKEERMWEKFISNYQETIETGKSLISENQAQLKETKKSQWKYLGFALLGAIIFGMPAGIIAYITGIHSIATIGGVSGAMFFLTNKINKEKEGNAK